MPACYSSADRPEVFLTRYKSMRFTKTGPSIFLIMSSDVRQGTIALLGMFPSLSYYPPGPINDTLLLSRYSVSGNSL